MIIRWTERDLESEYVLISLVQSATLLDIFHILVNNKDIGSNSELVMLYYTAECTSNIQKREPLRQRRNSTEFRRDWVFLWQLEFASQSLSFACTRYSFSSLSYSAMQGKGELLSSNAERKKCILRKSQILAQYCFLRNTNAIKSV